MRQVTARFHNVDAAMDAGYELGYVNGAGNRIITGCIEGQIYHMIAISQARAHVRVQAINAKFDDRRLPTTKAEADQLMADMISDILGRRVDPPT